MYFGYAFKMIKLKALVLKNKLQFLGKGTCELPGEKYLCHHSDFA